MHLIVREWVNFQPELELRAFVFENRLTAATQYYSVVPVKLLIERRLVRGSERQSIFVQSECLQLFCLFRLCCS